MSLGLSTNQKFVERFLYTLTKGSKKLEILTLKKFLKVFEYDKFGQQAVDLIAEEFKEEQLEKYNKLKQKMNK